MGFSFLKVVFQNRGETNALLISNQPLKISDSQNHGRFGKHPLIKVSGNGNFPSEENNYKSRGVFFGSGEFFCIGTYIQGDSIRNALPIYVC